MFVGTTIFKMDGNDYRTPEFPQGGQAATFAVDVLNLVGSPTLTITVEHRATDNPTWSTAGTFSNITAPGVATKDVTDLNELIRLTVAFAAGDDATDGAHLLIMPPSWRPF